MRIAAIILAAGASTRMGEPKALLKNRGQSMLEATLEPYRLQNIRPLVITGFHAAAVEMHARRLGLPAVRNPAPNRGMASSVRTGLERLDSDTEIVFIHPVDCPGVRCTTLNTLSTALSAFSWAEAAKPTFKGRGGHPLVLRRTAWIRLLGSRRMNPRQLLGRLHGRVIRVEVDDSAVLRDLDEPADMSGWLTSDHHA